MPEVRPFAAVRPRPDLASRICELPYDVFSTEEARALAASNPLSFLHVSRPEVDLAGEVSPHAPEVYARGRENYVRLQGQGALRRDAAPAFYLYRQVMGAHAQTGIVGVASCAEYRAGAIRKHELTRIDKEDDRVRHIEVLEAQTGPAFLVHPRDEALTVEVAEGVQGPPDMDFTAADGVRHTTWTVRDAARVGRIGAAFLRMPRMYIADGHHRTAAAARVAELRGGRGGSGFFLSVIFPEDQVQILAYHRVVLDLGGRAPAEVRRVLASLGSIEETGRAVPAGRHEVAFYLEGRWATLRFRPELVGHRDAVERLDVAILQREVLAPWFGIGDPRTSERIGFVGGIRGTGELERLVGSGRYALAFSMYPTSMAELMAVADGGGLMPPKSTWFEPKLRDALFCHNLEPLEPG